MFLPLDPKVISHLVLQKLKCMKPPLMNFHIQLFVLHTLLCIVLVVPSAADTFSPYKYCRAFTLQLFQKVKNSYDSDVF